ncbi:hypothetical protein DUNSADRAFT_6770, partial [Dunaliella salina]
MVCTTSQAHSWSTSRAELWMCSCAGCSPSPPPLKEPTGRTSRGDLLVAQKGPGELLGEMSLFSKSITRCASVRCVTKVTVRIITHEQLVEYLIKQPMAKHQIRESIWKKECEITMVEALVKLASVHEALDASLHSQVGW